MKKSAPYRAGAESDDGEPFRRFRHHCPFKGEMGNGRKDGGAEAEAADSIGGDIQLAAACKGIPGPDDGRHNGGAVTQGVGGVQRQVR